MGDKSTKQNELIELLKAKTITFDEYDKLRNEIAVETENNYNQLENKNNKKIRTIGFIILFLLLSFHIVPSSLTIFPKDHFTLSNTFLSENDIDKIISRYNNSNGIERTIILQDPLINKLFEKGILIETSINNKE